MTEKKRLADCTDADINKLYREWQTTKGHTRRFGEWVIIHTRVSMTHPELYLEKSNLTALRKCREAIKAERRNLGLEPIND